jgi:hypothetical protein
MLHKIQPGFFFAAIIRFASDAYFSEISPDLSGDGGRTASAGLNQSAGVAIDAPARLQFPMLASPDAYPAILELRISNANHTQQSS